MPTKRCPRCGSTKPLDQFYKRTASTDGLSSACRDCINAAAEYRSRNRERINKAAAKYRADNAELLRSLGAARRADPQYREEARQRTARWREDNPQRSRSSARDYYARSKDRVADYQARYRAEHPDKQHDVQKNWYARNGERKKQWRRTEYRLQSALNSAMRRARIAGASTVPFTEAQVRAKFAYWGNRCWICRDNATSLDHVKPLAKGGPHIVANFRPICGPCNMVKNQRWPLTPDVIAWLRTRPRIPVIGKGLGSRLTRSRDVQDRVS